MPTDPAVAPKQPRAGPDAPSSSVTPEIQEQPTANELNFHFAPPIMGALVNPPIETLEEGTDAWAIHLFKASVTPLRAGYGEPGEEGMRLASEAEGNVNGRKFKL